MKLPPIRLNAQHLPDVQLNADAAPKKVQFASFDNVEYIVSALGITVRYNMQRACAEFTLQSGVDAETQVAQEYIEHYILDECTRLGIANHKRVQELLRNLALHDPYHPMEEWLLDLPNSAGNAIDDLINSVITENPLWPTYCRKWLVQCVEAVCGWRDRQTKLSIPHVLVLVGAQGVGKSRWLKMLGGKWFKGEAELQLGSFAGKDHQIEALKYPMAELSELDGIFRKNDIAHMKSFISREEDAIREPYERRAVTRPRMTSFCASVNDTEFLNDNSGSRRFWPVIVDEINWAYRVDWEGVWAEAYDLWESGMAFNLDHGEDAERARQAQDVHALASPEAELITEYYRRHHGHPAFPDVPMNRTEILQMLYGKGQQFWTKTISDTGKTLTNLIGQQRTIDGKQRAWPFPYNENAIDHETWPDKNHLKSVT